MRDFGGDEDEVEHHSSPFRDSTCPGEEHKKSAPLGPGRLGIIRVEPDLLVRSRFRHIDAADLPVEVDASVYQRKDGVIATKADVLSRVPLRAALANNDVASDDCFAAEFFNAEPLAAGVAAILDGALSFFMSHGIRGLRGEGRIQPAMLVISNLVRDRR